MQKGIVAALLKRIYGARSEKMTHDQLLLEFLGDEVKKPAAAVPEDQGPAAETQEPKTRARRTNKLSESRKNLPTVIREIIHPEVLAAPATSAC